jgi:hypothetical protein
VVVVGDGELLGDALRDGVDLLEAALVDGVAE